MVKIRENQILVKTTETPLVDRESDQRGHAAGSIQRRLTLQEIMALDGTLPPATWRIEGIQYDASKLILGGDSNVGKTWAELNASLAVASGKDAWGRFPTSQGPVMFFACEGMYRLTIEAVAKVARGLGIEDPDEIPFELRFRDKVQLSVPKWRADLIAEIKEKGVVRLVFDPLAMAAIFNEISGEEWAARIFEPVDEIIDATGTSVALTHHANKLSLMPDTKVPAKAALRGHTSLPAWADSILFMRETNQGLVVEHAKMRGPKLGKFNLTIVHEDESVRVLCEDSDSKDKRTEELTRAVHEALGGGSELTQGKLERTVRHRVGGVTSGVVRSRVTQMTKEGIIEDLGGGGQGKAHRYRLMEVVT